jgi:hypothetical protein
LDQATHDRIYAEEIFPRSGFQQTTPQEHPRAIVLAGQPGAGKGGLVKAAEREFAGNIVTLDLDEKRRFHEKYKILRETHPYTWATHTHQDARGWTDKLSHDFIEGRRNIVFDTTLGDADHWIGEMKSMQALQKHPYEVEVRVLATHRLESEHGVHERFTDSLDKKGYGRFVPQEVRSSVYDNLPANLDKVHAQLPHARIRIYNREGIELYDSRTSPLKPGAALEQTRDARLTDPERTRSLNNKWQTQQAWEQQLPESLQRNPKVTPPTAENVLREHSDLKVKADVQRTATEAAAIDRSVRIEPGAARVALGLKVFGTAALAHDTLTTGRDTKNLLDHGNVTGAESEVLHFAGRNLGMVGGAMAVGSAAAAAGIETGPGALAAGLAGGLVGAVAGDKIMDAVDQSRIYNQRGSDGNDWSLDPRQPAQGWTRLPRPGEFGPQGPPEGVDYENHLLHAVPRLADELNYKASNVAVELALAHPRAPQDPFRQVPESIGETVRPGIGASQPWLRDPQSHAWTRQATEAATPMTHGMPVKHTVTASPEQSRQLDAAAQRVVADNIVHSPQGIAQRYQEAYTQHGWKQHGPVPAAVTHAAQGHVREEPDAARQQTPAQSQPVSGHLTPQQIERITTHESRIVPTPGGMSFAEAHRRRDEPEQISAGSLRPVGKLDEIQQVKGSPLYRVHQAQEQDLMRSLGIAQAQDRERFKDEPSPQRTLQTSMNARRSRRRCRNRPCHPHLKCRCRRTRTLPVQRQPLRRRRPRRLRRRPNWPRCASRWSAWPQRADTTIWSGAMSATRRGARRSARRAATSGKVWRLARTANRYPPLPWLMRAARFCASSATRAIPRMRWTAPSKRCFLRVRLRDGWHRRRRPVTCRTSGSPTIWARSTASTERCCSSRPRCSANMPLLKPRSLCAQCSRPCRTCSSSTSSARMIAPNLRHRLQRKPVNSRGRRWAAHEGWRCRDPGNRGVKSMPQSLAERDVDKSQAMNQKRETRETALRKLQSSGRRAAREFGLHHQPLRTRIADEVPVRRAADRAEADARGHLVAHLRDAAA